MLLFYVVFINSISVFAADDISLGIPSYGGTGCPRGTATTALNPDTKSISILFDEYVVEAGGVTERSTTRKTCNLAIPINVPGGVSLSIYKIDYRGYNSLPLGAYSQFNVEYFFAGSKGPNFRTTFFGLLERSYYLTDNIQNSSVYWSECGKDVILRSNSSMLVKTNSLAEEAFATVDSADFSAGLLYHLQSRPCS